MNLRKTVRFYWDIGNKFLLSSFLADKLDYHDKLFIRELEISYVPVKQGSQIKSQIVLALPTPNGWDDRFDDIDKIRKFNAKVIEEFFEANSFQLINSDFCINKYETVQLSENCEYKIITTRTFLRQEFDMEKACRIIMDLVCKYQELFQLPKSCFKDFKIIEETSVVLEEDKTMSLAEYLQSIYIMASIFKANT